MDVFRLLVVGILLAILVSLGVALFHLATGKGNSGKLVRALSWRIGLSLGLLLLLLFAWSQGWIQPRAQIQ